MVELTVAVLLLLWLIGEPLLLEIKRHQAQRRVVRQLFAEQQARLCIAAITRTTVRAMQQVVQEERQRQQLRSGRP